MREFLFRAKRKDTGEWRESGAFSRATKSSGSRYFLSTEVNPNAHAKFDRSGNLQALTAIGNCFAYLIDPETLGQYTGVEDKNGKRIFEGDIVRVKRLWNEGTCVISFEHGSFYIASLDKAICDGPLWSFWFSGDEMEVIGNIHDNPELLPSLESESE